MENSHYYNSVKSYMFFSSSGNELPYISVSLGTHKVKWAQQTSAYCLHWFSPRYSPSLSVVGGHCFGLDPKELQRR